MLTKTAQHIKGHDEVKDQLNQALKKSKLAHALLFSGPSGVGKREMAWALAQSLLCEQEEPCGKCYSCLSISKKQSVNVLCVTHETLQIRLQDLKKIQSFLSLQSFEKAKVVLMDSAERLNIQASNFLLKIIEEPPPKSFFFLISSAPSRLPLTLRSRVQNLRFQALPEAVIKELAPSDTPQWMIRGCRGRLDILEVLKDQTEARGLSFDLWSEMFNRSFSALEMDFPKKIENRKSALSICRFWQQILRDVRFLKSGYPDKLTHGDKKQEMKKLSQFSYGVLDTLIKKILEMEADLQANVDYILCFENFVIDMKKNIDLLKGQ